MSKWYKNKLSLTRIMGAKEPLVFYVTEQSYSDGDRFLQGFEIVDGDIDDHSGFEVIIYPTGEFSMISSRAKYDELTEFIKTEIL